VALAVVSWPLAAPAATHPEGTTVAHPATEADFLRIAILDKVEARRVTLAFPVGRRIPLPDGVHSLKVRRFSADFSLARGPGEAPPDKGDGEPVGDKPDEGNPAALVELFREGQSVGSSWIFAKAPHLFQPSNMRYNFELVGSVTAP
jgi:hypothetical protein